MNTNLPGRQTVMMGLCLAILSAAGTRQAEVLLPDAECRAFLKQMAPSIQAHNTLKARFLQERRLALFDDVLKMEGYFYYRKPGRIRWEFIDPYASIMLLLEDGRTERFEIIGGRAVKARTDDRQISGEVLTQISRWLKGDFEHAMKDFDVEMHRGAKVRLVLRPKSESLASFLSRIEFEIDSRSYLVLAVSLWEGENDVTVIRFLDLDVDPLLPDDLFDADGPRLLTEGER
ncbi:MAG TPA: outer membrane lipoprotein carrier protein LolA [Acidobacteriota bacterium]|nr:outer membrane lipoprotein carrier protein LolA [Acidobacteriota bacterium]